MWLNFVNPEISYHNSPFSGCVPIRYKIELFCQIVILNVFSGQLFLLLKHFSANWRGLNHLHTKKEPVTKAVRFLFVTLALTCRKTGEGISCGHIPGIGGYSCKTDQPTGSQGYKHNKK
jgi:hypothetical protein